MRKRTPKLWTYATLWRLAMLIGPISMGSGYHEYRHRSLVVYNSSRIAVLVEPLEYIHIYREICINLISLSRSTLLFAIPSYYIRVYGNVQSDYICRTIDRNYRTLPAVNTHFEYTSFVYYEYI